MNLLLFLIFSKKNAIPNFNFCVTVRTTFGRYRVLVIDIAIVQRMTLSGYYFETFLAFVMISLNYIVKCETVTGSHTASAVFTLQDTKLF